MVAMVVVMVVEGVCDGVHQAAGGTGRSTQPRVMVVVIAVLNNHGGSGGRIHHGWGRVDHWR